MWEDIKIIFLLILLYLFSLWVVKTSTHLNNAKEINSRILYFTMKWGNYLILVLLIYAIFNFIVKIL